MQHVLLSAGAHPTRIWRFIKLYPELGVFQDPASTDETSTTETKRMVID